ncbi:clamp loader subunit [Synechococcus phage syn9]|uniref:Clamp loader subunit n=1 Tax=Synechococcus phage syn9 TaxID=382359 RepID=Q0QZ66_BPSYS|nr:clamp loader of DNA polymerase [Synechococcus phage syn9]ABA47130.1 clamp loader subunit [Synechococcus phage syn9]AGH56518.1 clamp loader subunit [Cyanophage Syn10]
MAYDERYPLKDYLNSINQTKENLLDSEDAGWEKNYPPYVINKCMSQHIDTVMYANEMNQWRQLPNKLQYDFFINTVRPRKRFSPWAKKEKMNDLEIVKQYYGYSNEKARQALSILTPDQLSFIKSKLDKGGKKR